MKTFDTEPITLSEWEAKSRSVPVRFSIPLGRLQPGPYDFQVTVLDPTSGRAAFWRTGIVIVK
jgi:hypothetical protein